MHPTAGDLRRTLTQTFRETPGRGTATVGNMADDQIDETMPGSGSDGADGVASQLDPAETLLDRGVRDPLDEGVSPPDRDPGINVPTQSEEEHGLSLTDRLAQETPDISAGDEDSLYDEYGEEVGDERAGRLVDPDLGSGEDTEKDLLAGDVGIDGAGASAEEAAVHIIAD